MGQLAIIADDLSSCTDCGIQIARDGFQTFVVLGEEPEYQQFTKYDVIALDTDSRAVSPGEAYKRVHHAAQSVKGLFHSIYKSLDSTLRGNLGVEIDAVLDTADFDFAVVAPAFPFYGRTTIAGVHYLHGRPISETEFGSDPQSPVRESNLAKLLSSQSNRKVGELELEVLRGGADAVSEKIGELIMDEVELMIFDVQEEADLTEIVNSVDATGYRVLWVGSTGLAGHISKILSGRSDTQVMSESRRDPSNPIMIVAGSASEITREQLDQIKRKTNTVTFQINPLKILQNSTTRGEEIFSCQEGLLNSFKLGRDAILTVASSRKDIRDTQAFGTSLGISVKQISIMIVEALAEVVLGIVDRFQISGLVLTGGDTATAVCYSLKARGILILREIEPGIPLARLIGKHELQIVTKAGGFGNSDTLLHIYNVLKGQEVDE